MKKNNTITKFQYFTAFFFLLNSFIPLIGFTMLTQVSNQDALFSILIGGLEMILFILLVKNIYNFNTRRTLFEKIKALFPKVSIVFFLGFFLIISGLICQITSEFTTFVNFYLLPQLENFWITLSLLILVYYFLQKPKESIFRTTEICFYLYILFFIISVLGILPQSNFQRIKPLFSSGITQILKSSFTFFLSLPLPTFLLLYFPKVEFQKKDNRIKTQIQTVISSTIFIFITLFLIISSIGIYLTNLYKNPLMITYQKISFLNILERVETTLSFSYILLYFFPLIFLIYILKELIINIFNLPEKKEKIVLFLILLIALFGNQFFNFEGNFYLVSNFLLGVFLIILSWTIYLK